MRVDRSILWHGPGGGVRCLGFGSRARWRRQGADDLAASSTAGGDSLKPLFALRLCGLSSYCTFVLVAHPKLTASLPPPFAASHVEGQRRIFVGAFGSS